MSMSSVEAALSRHDPTRSNLIPILQDVQEALGYLSESAVDRIAAYVGLSANDVFGVATFYAQFRFTPVGRHMVRVCRGTACHVRGSEQILRSVSSKLGIAPRGTTADLKFSLEQVACFGACALAPVVVIDNDVHARMSSTKAGKLIEEIE